MAKMPHRHGRGCCCKAARVCGKLYPSWGREPDEVLECEVEIRCVWLAAAAAVLLGIIRSRNFDC